MLRQQWEAKVVRLGKALSDLNEARENRSSDPTNMEYFEAVMRFSAARDEERLFFWEHFYEERIHSAEDTIRMTREK